MAGQGGLRARGRICVIFSINLKYFRAARWISHIDFIKGRDKTCLEPLWIGNRHEIMYLLSGHWFQGQKEMIFIFPPVLHDVIHPTELLDYHSELIITTLGWARQQHQSNFLSNWSKNVKGCQRCFAVIFTIFLDCDFHHLLNILGFYEYCKCCEIRCCCCCCIPPHVICKNWWIILRK